MKQLTCEMCGSTNLLKQDGVFVCQDCGTKYSVEEAKKMMVEGTVEVTGTVKVDSSSKLKNLYEIARRSRDDNNTEKAAQYYDMILQEDPMSWEASFYTTYYSAMQTNIAGIRSAAIKVSNCIDTVLKLIKDNVPEEKEQLSAVLEVNIRVMSIASMLYNAAESHYNGIDIGIRSKYTQEYVDRLRATRDLMYNMGNQIEKIWGGNEAFGAIAATAWKDGVAKHKKLLQHLGMKEFNLKDIDSYSQKIGKYDPKYLEKHDEEVKKRDKEAGTARIKAIDGQIATLSKGEGTKVTGGQKFCGVLSILFALYKLYNISNIIRWSAGDEDFALSPIIWITPVLLIACGVILMIGMKGPEPWRKVAGGVAIVWSADGFLGLLRYPDLPNLIQNGIPDLVLLICGIYLIRQKYDPEKVAADKKKVEELEKEKAELEKKLAELG